MKTSLLNGTNLAYIGDAYYELYVRNYLLNKGIFKAHELTKAKIKYVSAKAHHQIYSKLETFLTEEEKAIFQKGKNATSTSHRKNVDYRDYNVSTGLEALVGYLYLEQKWERLEEIMREIIRIAEEEPNDHLR